MDFFNVHWKYGEHKGKANLQGADKRDVTMVFNGYAHMDRPNYYNIPFEAEITKITGPLGRPSSPKQRLAQKYGFIIGSIIGAQKQMDAAYQLLPNGIDSQKAARAVALVDSQFAKLKRDISDLFKLAGLKVK